MRDNESNQSDVAYVSTPNERDNKGMPKSDQFPGDKMPQGNTFQNKKRSIKNGRNSNKEYR